MKKLLLIGIGIGFFSFGFAQETKQESTNKEEVSLQEKPVKNKSYISPNVSINAKSLKKVKQQKTDASTLPTDSSTIEIKSTKKAEATEPEDAK